MYTIDDYFRETSDDREEKRIGNPLSPIRPKEALKVAINQMIDTATEITITFKPQLQMQWNETGLREIVECCLRRALRRAPTTCKILLIGEHSPVGLFHYHGILHGIPNDYVARIRRACARDLGRTEIKMIKYTDSYKDYLMKSYSESDSRRETWARYSYITINIPDSYYS